MATNKVETILSERARIEGETIVNGGLKPTYAEIIRQIIGMCGREIEQNVDPERLAAPEMILDYVAENAPTGELRHQAAKARDRD